AKSTTRWTRAICLTDAGGDAYASRMRTTIAFVALALLLVRTETRAQAPSCTFTTGALPVDTLPSGTPHGDQIPVEHIVVLMQETRPPAPPSARRPRKSAPPRGTTNPDPLGGDPIKPFHQPRYCEVADLAHSWNRTHLEFNGGAMDGFTTQNVDTNDPSGSR